MPADILQLLVAPVYTVAKLADSGLHFLDHLAIPGVPVATLLPTLAAAAILSWLYSYNGSSGL